MAKKAKGTKNHSGEILDDNGTLIATAPGVRAPSSTAPAKAKRDRA